MSFLDALTYLFAGVGVIWTVCEVLERVFGGDDDDDDFHGMRLA